MTSTNLKIIACLTMLIDHLGAVFFREYIILRIIGRLAFPIFAYLIAEGFFHTRDVKKYLIRLGTFALVSEIPFDLAFSGKLLDFRGFNVFFTLFFALIVIYIYDKHKSIGILALIVIGMIAQIMNTDYGIFGILIIFGFYCFRGNFLKQILNFTGVTLLMVLGTWSNYNYQTFNLGVILQGFSIISFIFIYLYNGKKGKNIKYLFYVFYPGHLLIIGLLKLVLLK